MNLIKKMFDFNIEYEKSQLETQKEFELLQLHIDSKGLDPLKLPVFRELIFQGFKFNEILSLFKENKKYTIEELVPIFQYKDICLEENPYDKTTYKNYIINYFSTL